MVVETAGRNALPDSAANTSLVSCHLRSAFVATAVVAFVLRRQARRKDHFVVRSRFVLDERSRIRPRSTAAPRCRRSQTTWLARRVQQWLGNRGRKMGGRFGAHVTGAQGYGGTGFQPPVHASENYGPGDNF